MLFIPTEGYGYSNNEDAKFGPPLFKKWIFELKDNMKMNCHPTYLNFFMELTSCFIPIVKN
jgi:uncharacterized protein (DUF2141 family)